MSAEHIERLTATARRRSEQTHQRARKALDTLTKHGQAVTVAGLAKKAAVSRSWIYTQPDLLERIAVLQQTAPARPTQTAKASQASL